MTAPDVSSQTRGRLRQFLTKRFNLEELKNLCFDLGVDYEMFRHQTKGELSREILAYFERSQNLSCLVAEMVKLRPADELVAMLAELGNCSPRSKVQIVLPVDKLKDRARLVAELAKVLGVAQEEVMIIATAPGSIRLLVSLPAEQADKLVALSPNHLGDAYEVSSITAFGALSAEAQNAWRKAALPGKPPIALFGLSGGALILAIIAGVLVTAVIAAVLVTPQVTVTNRCSDDIRVSETFPVIGRITVELAAGESRDYPIPPGDYVFRYDGQRITAQVPIIGRIGPYDASDDIDARYENQIITAGRSLRESIGLGDNPEIVLCPSGR